MKSTEKQLAKLNKNKEACERTVKRNKEELSKNEAELNSINANIKLLNETATEYDLGAPIGIVKMTPVEYKEFIKRFIVTEKKEIQKSQEPSKGQKFFAGFSKCTLKYLLFTIILSLGFAIIDSCSGHKKPHHKPHHKPTYLDSIIAPPKKPSKAPLGSRDNPIPLKVETKIVDSLWYTLDKEDRK